MTRFARLLAACDGVAGPFRDEVALRQIFGEECDPEMVEFLAALAAFDDVVREADECVKP